jgi:hypothetical protein
MRFETANNKLIGCIKVGLLVLILLGSIAGYSQEQQKKGYEISINDSDGYVKVSVRKLKLKANELYTYYWYAFNKIMNTKGGYGGALLNGDYAQFYFNNNLKEKGSFKAGVKCGKWIEWYYNGKIKQVSNWHNSMKNGKRKVYDENGVIVLEENYYNDVLDGEVKEYQSGKVVSVKHYKKGTEYTIPVKGTSKNGDSLAGGQTNTDSTSTSGSENKQSFFSKIKNIFHSKKKASEQSDKPDDNKNG